MVRILSLSLVLLLVLLAAFGDQRRSPLPEPPAHFSVAADTRVVLAEPWANAAPETPVKAANPAPVRPARILSGPRRFKALVKIEELEPAVKKYAAQHGVDEDLVWAVMCHESGFNPRAVSPKGAMGLMQLMPGTAALMGVTDPFDPDQNIAGGTKYLELCLKEFHHDVALALAAYNAGPQNVAKYQGCPPFAETQHYVAAVLQTYSGSPQYRRAGLVSSVNEEVTELLNKVGLPWRVPLPQWRTPQPRFHVEPARWKGSRANLVSLAR
jgi:soluble lytic murein transglycosylase-like protein